MSLMTPIAKLPRLQPQIAKKFAQLGLLTLRDCLFTFPFRHEDWRQRVAIADLQPGQEVTLLTTVTHITSRRAWHRRGTHITDMTMTDESGGRMHVLWFNLPFLAKTVRVGDRLYVSGTVKEQRGQRQMHNPVYERPSADPLHTHLVPVYRTTDGLSQRQFRLVMKQAVELADAVPDPLPVTATTELGFLTLPEALRAIHFPDTPAMAHRAVERLKFDELLSWHLRLVTAQQTSAVQPAPIIRFHEPEVRTFVQHLPFTLTDDQRMAAWQILQDIAQPQPMSRLVQGDVGSGKTVVAALAAYNVALNHFQVALVAPTVILAEQHWHTFVAMLGKHDTAIALLTGSEARIAAGGSQVTVSRAELLASIAVGRIAVVIGTHAVLQPDVAFPKLGLVIVDEQQRFGVDQRQSLLADRTVTPHFLSLTATPIPRSFALWLTGILSLSTIKSKPPGRPPIASSVIGPAERGTVDQAISAAVAQGQQVYVITPLIEETDGLGVRAATSEHERLTEQYPHLRCGLIHGAMPAADRIAILGHFRRHELELLVSTTVIEVGVDVPNATLMVVEGSDRFGLAQLHQLRGRVGRGLQPSRCLFVTDRDSPEIRQRLERVAQTTDGFAIAELDYAERGAGDLYGQRQSGLPTWQLASLSDRGLFERVRSYVSRLSPVERQQHLHDLTADEPLPSGFHPE